ncbi:MAG TPA: hypothetical protein VFZ09_03445 [Archangium sp.]|uniref:hypothetical protein n=1 Tax=Archangium sp. TaxID=1872627 RepID=UPI002E360464|nr:hypothetical protein [Archangium sp.]HEX5745271.1 hypothetical protein [Archangium sp.]
MSTKPLKAPLPDEHILQVEPPPRTFVNAGWRVRPHLYTDRALSAESLSREQHERSGRLALRGQLVAPGVVAGLEVRLDREPGADGKEDLHVFEVGPGLGLTVSGEDVLQPRATRVRVDQVPVFRLREGQDTSSFDLDVLASVKATQTHQGLRAAVLVLVPVVSKREDPPAPNDPAELDPERHALEDQRLVDGYALVLFAWPDSWPMPDPEALAWRNRLAWTLFEAERQRPHQTYAPWEEVGVPLALIGFTPPMHVDAPATPLFADSASVVRTGGAPRSRPPLLEAHGNPLLWQARLQQFSEHLDTFSSEQLADGTAIQSFAFLPPVGRLPKQAVDFRQWTHRFFPAPFIIDAAPMPLEQLDAVALASASLAPLDTSAQERVRVLVPVPEAHFEPRLLQSELLDPAFPKAITSGLERLGEWLRRRTDLRGKATLLLNALEGERSNRYPTEDPAWIPGEYEGEVPLDPSQYGPEEATYGTEGKTVPVLEEALWLNGTWAQPEQLGWDSGAVSTAVSPTKGTFAVVTRYYSSFSSSYLSVRRFTKDSPVARDFLYYPAAWLDFKAVWSGGELVIVILAYNPLLKDRPTPGFPRVAFMRRTPTGWVTSVPKYLGAGISPRSILHFTAVSWGPGRIDAFVGTTSSILKVSWLDGAPQDVQVLNTSVSRTVNQIVALSPSAGRLELLYLGRSPSDPSYAEYWLHHLSCFHEGDGPDLRQADGDATLDVVEVKSLKGFQLAACISKADDRSPRLDVLVLSNGATQGIRHGWYDAGSWKFGMQMVSKTNADALEVVSKGDGRIHAFWWDDTFPMPGPLTYRLFDEGRWQTAELLTRQFLSVSTSRQSFSVVLDGTNPIDVLMASNNGLLHLKKVADSTRVTVRQQGLRGLIGNIEGLHKQALDFVRTSSARIQDELQHVRELMLTSSTEASRLAVSATFGSTLVGSPLVTQNSNGDFLTRFHPRVGLARIRLSDAMEALEQASTVRRELTAQLVELVKKIVRVKEIGLDLTNMFLLGISKIVPGSSPRRVELLPVTWPGRTTIDTKTVVREDLSLRDLVNNAALLEDALRRLDEEPENVRRALAQARLKWTESDYFSTALRHLEHTLALLRTLELRMTTRVGSVSNYKATLDRIEAFWSELDKRMRLVDGEVAEGRQDVTVARALLAEEMARIDAVNQRRAQILEQHVPFLVFQRSRHRELTRDTPSRLLDPGLVKDILPEVFASTDAAPPELLAYVEFVRDSSLKWFTLAPQLLRGLDRTELIHRTFARAQVRALQRMPISLPIISGRTPTRLALGLSRLMSAREDFIARQRGAFIRFEPAVLYTQTWLELQQSAHAQLSLGDLIDMAHGRSDVARNTATELEHISKVATGLYQRFGEVLPVIRLEWAEQLSQYDAPVDLHDLSRLPRWDELEVTERREMQTLVDWLFQRVVTTEPEAMSLMNDLVRICLLLASHAPVDELLSGHVSKPSVARVGGTLELAVDPARVRIGMHVLIRSGEQTVQAVVEDLSSSVVKARVLSASSTTVHLPEKTSARFADPARGTGALLPYMGAEW